MHYYVNVNFMFCFSKGLSKTRMRDSSLEKYSNVSLSVSENESSLGDPSSPPPSPPTTVDIIPDSTKSSKQNSEHELNDYGLDTDAFTYELDAQTNFELGNGKFLRGEELITHLKTCNDTLKDKVKIYHQKCSDLQQKIYEEQDTCYRIMESIRHFYRNLIFFGNSRGATMVKMAMNQT